MQKLPWLLFWASVALMAVGIVDRLMTASPLIAGVASGSYWKAGMALIAYSVALKLLRSEAPGV